MKGKMTLVIVVAALCLAVLPGTAPAEIHRFFFNIWTHTHDNPPPTPDTQRLDIFMELVDSQRRAYDAIKSLTVTAPDGTVFTLSNFYWMEWEQTLIGLFPKESFKTGVIPTGTYTAVVQDLGGKTLTRTETLSAVTFLPIPTVTYPAHESTIGTLTPTLTWSKVAGATFYRVYLINENWKQPVYYTPGFSRIHRDPFIRPAEGQVLEVYGNSFAIPRGVLFPKTKYSLQIEARDSDKNLNRRSRSIWVTFSTP